MCPCSGARGRCSLGGSVRSCRSGAGRSCGRRGDRLHCWARHFPFVGDERTPTARLSELAEAIRVNGLQQGARSKRQQASTCSTASRHGEGAATRSTSSRACRNREATAHHICGARGRKFYAAGANLGVRAGEYLGGDLRFPSWQVSGRQSSQRLNIRRKSPRENCMGAFTKSDPSAILTPD